MKLNATRSIAIALAAVCLTTFALAQKHSRKFPRPQPSLDLSFIERDHTCVNGPIVKINPKAVTVQPAQSSPVVIARPDLLRASQNGSLIYSARSSWADVQAIHLLPREEISFRLRSGKLVRGIPLQITPQTIEFKFILWTRKRYPKKQIVTVDYLRRKPNSSAFDTYTQESPDTMLFFYPELYDQSSTLVGRIPVRLYDALKPEDDSPLSCPAR